MPNKKQLQKLEAILESTIMALEKEESGKHQMSTASLAYETGLNILLTKDSFKNLVNERNRIKTAKITRAAKNLLIQFEDFGVTSYLDFSDSVKLNVKAINLKSKLAPIKEEVIAKVEASFRNFELEADAFYNSMLMDIFNQGRQHQTIANPKTKTTYKKFASYGYDENQNFEALSNVLKDELMVYMSYLKDFVYEDIENSYNISLNKSAMVKSLTNSMEKSSSDMQEIFRKHSWQAYSFGNLYQLEKDNAEFVAWQTGHHADDCLTCRAFQTGATILKDSDGNNLEYTLDTDAVIYRLEDISKVARMDGPAFFCHEGCRCQFVSYDKKTSF